MDRNALVSRVLELKEEIELLEQEGCAYVAVRNPSRFDRECQDRRIRRLEEIQLTIRAASKLHLWTQTAVRLANDGCFTGAKLSNSTVNFNSEA